MISFSCSKSSSTPFCDGMQRRNFLQIGAFGIGLTLADLLRAKATAGTTNRSADSKKQDTLSNSKTSRPKSAIMIYLPGGPSHIDTYDPKPEAPTEFRGEFKAIPTNVSGVQLSEHFALQAKMFDKLAVIRSLVSVDEHSDSLVSTGYSENTNRTAHHPSMGAVISKLRPGNSEIPQFVSLRGASVGLEPGYLGVAHRAFTPSGPGMANLAMRGDVREDRLNDRKVLLQTFDSIRREIDATSTMKGMDTFNERAFDMITSGTTRKALDLSYEEPRVRDRYKGLEPFLQARRLIEAGVGFVTLQYGGWDTHDRNFEQLRRQNPMLDRGIANLIQDLHDRGLQDDVVTVVWGEFGRTPKVNGNAGRDHWSPVMSAMIAGGGLKMGQAIGTSSARGETPKDRPYKVSNVLATIYHALGIDPSMTFPNGNGRPMYVLDERELVNELI